jgi:transketolase
MRATFIQTLIELAEADDKIVLITGDLGFGVVEPFVARFPGRFLNVGVAEQNMAGIASGMALSGKIVFTYSIGNFPTLRCLEQIRNDVCYHNANVKIVSVGAGLAYGALGASHHATEDIAVVRALPNMTVLSPADAIEAEMATRAAAAHDGPVYLRLARTNEAAVHAGTISFEIGKAIPVMEGNDITLIATGSMVHISAQAAGILASTGVQARVLSMHTLRPLDEEAIRSAACETGAIMTIEEHSRIGGLGSAVAEVLAEYSERAIPFRRVALPSEFVSLVGSQNYLREAYSLSAAGIAKAALATWRHAKTLPPANHSAESDVVLKGCHEL